MNDLEHAILNSSSVYYADDITIYTTGKNVTELETELNTDLNEIYLWSCSNKLVINSDKTKSMLFTSLPQVPLNLTINFKPIDKVSSFKYLGLWLQENLKFNKHISELTNIISQSNGIIYSLKRILPLKSLISLYYAIVFSHLNMHILAWGGSRQPPFGT